VIDQLLGNPEFGQCVHKIAMHPARPERMCLQNHWGLYRSDDGEASWLDIANGVPSDFGFPMIMHQRDPDCAFTSYWSNRTNFVARQTAGRRLRPQCAPPLFREHVNVFVGSEHVRKVADGSEISIVPAISGGTGFSLCVCWADQGVRHALEADP
jgi:hypothetical protein